MATSAISRSRRRIAQARTRLTKGIPAAVRVALAKASIAEDCAGILRNRARNVLVAALGIDHRDIIEHILATFTATTSGKTMIFTMVSSQASARPATPLAFNVNLMTLEDRELAINFILDNPRIIEEWIAEGWKDITPEDPNPAAREGLDLLTTNVWMAISRKPGEWIGSTSKDGLIAFASGFMTRRESVIAVSLVLVLQDWIQWFRSSWKQTVKKTIHRELLK